MQTCAKNLVTALLNCFLKLLNSQISPIFLLSHLWPLLQDELHLCLCEMRLRWKQWLDWNGGSLLQTWQSSRQIRFSFTIRPITGDAFPEKGNFIYFHLFKCVEQVRSLRQREGKSGSCSNCQSIDKVQCTGCK